MPQFNNIGARIKQLRQQAGLSQQQFAQRIGIRQSSLSQLEQGGINPSFETLQHMVQEFGASYNYLMTGQDAALPTQPTVANSISKPVVKASKPKAAHAEKLYPLPLINQKAAAGVPVAFADEEFIEQQPHIVYPGIKTGLAIQVSGASMEPTIKPNDILLCTPVTNLADELQDNQVYVVVTQDGALVKRIVSRLATEQALLLKSDNREYSSMLVPVAEVVQVFRVRRRITADLAGPEAYHNRMDQLEQALFDLRDQQERLEQQVRTER